MERTRLARTSISELKKRIILAQERKSKITQYLQELWEKYQTGKISRDFYVETAHRHFDGKTLKEWVEYYDNYINECEILIKKHKKDLLKGHFRTFVFSFILIIVLLSVSLYTQPRFVGFLIQEPVPVSEIVTDANATITTTQQQAILGQPVKWTKTISLDKPTKTKIRLPIEATNISVNKISYSEENLVEVLQNQTSPFQEEPLPSSETEKQEALFSITGLVTAEDAGIREGLLSRFFRNLGRITGRAIYEPEEKLEIEINDTATEYEIEYQTDAPYAIEEPLTTAKGKRVKIIGPETIHYENVLSFTTLDESLNIKNPRNVKIFWREENKFISPTSIQDTNNNGIYDYIEWIAPVLSEQTFDIIVIIKAEHLDSNRNFVSDIYEEVKDLDNIWSEEIPSEDYVRVVFEIPLDNKRDITIYPRVVSGNPKIEVYEFQGTEIIAEFTSLNSNEYNKIFLDGSSGAGLGDKIQDTFDLKILDGSVEIDHIIDPFESLTVITCTISGCSVTNYNDNTTSIGASISKNSEDQVNISATSDLGGLDTINNVTLDFRWTNVVNLDGQWGITPQSQDGLTNYCTAIAVPQTDLAEDVYTVIDIFTGCVDTKAELDDLRFNIRNSDAGQGQTGDVLYVNVTINFTVVSDTEQPKWQENTTNSTEAGTLIKHSVRWTDDTALDGFIFSFDNGTGTFVNDSFVSMTGTNNYSNVTKVVNSTVGSTIQWIVYANDSSNNFNNTDTFIYTTTSANAAPTIDFVEAIPGLTPNESSTNTTSFNFTATDTDGFTDINVSSAQGFFQRAGETTRSDLSCVNWSQSGNDVNFTCTIGMFYYDEAGSWTINVTVRDNADETAENSSTTFTYLTLTAMVMSPTALGWDTINLTDTDTGSTSDPITLNNTGNAVNLNINITAFNLQGNTTLTEYIFAENFTVEDASEGCTGTAMVNATSTNVTSSILQRGNNTLNYNNATSGQEQIFFCLKGVPQDISAQEYSSIAYGAWEIRILLVAIIPAARRKKKKKEEDKLIESLDLLEYLHIVDKLKEQYGFSNEEIVKTIIEKASKKYNLDRTKLLRTIKAREGIDIPVTIFSKKLGALESIVKYMKENLGMNYREIAKELGRDERTIWTSYKKANEKQKEPIKPKETKINIPSSVFENKKLTMLESIIIYLKQKGFKFSEMEKLLERDQRNIGTIYSRAMKKIKNK